MKNTLIIFLLSSIVSLSQGQIVSLRDGNQWHFLETVEGVDINGTPYQYNYNLFKGVKGDTVIDSTTYKKIDRLAEKTRVGSINPL